MTFTRAAVVGLGMIGGSVAARLKEDGLHIQAFDVRRDHTSTGLRMGLIDRVCGTLREGLSDVDLVVLAAPIDAIRLSLKSVDDFAGPDALVTDTGSVKASITAAMTELSTGHRAVPGHPIAGLERSGPERADESLFVGRPWALCPHPANDPASIARAMEFVRMMGAEPVVVTSEHHDRILARTSHLPQILATALALTLQPDSHELSGSGLKDMTRLASSDPGIWVDVLIENRRNVRHAASELISQLSLVVEAVDRSDESRLRDLMVAGARKAMRATPAAPS